MAKKDVLIVPESVFESPVEPTWPMGHCSNCDTDKPVTEMMLGAGICHSCAGYVPHVPDAVETVEVEDAPA